jgi:cobalt-zinc-cadmium efflux system outer membrane protein
MTLEDLEQIALQCNPTLAQATMGVQAAEGNCVQSGLYPNPTIGYSGDEIGNVDTAGLQGGFINQEVVTAGKLRLARATACHGIEQARYAWEIQRQRVLSDVRASCSEVLLTQKTIEVNEQLVRVSQESLRTTQQLRKAQEASQANVLEATIEADTAKLNLESARTRHWSAWRHLAAVIGRPEMEPCQLAGNCEDQLPVLAWENVCAQVLGQSPELAQARASVERARCEVARQCANRVPNFTMQAGAQYDNETNYTVTNVQVSMPLPVFNRNQGNILRAEANLVAAQNEVRRIELDLHDRLATVFEQYINARRQTDAYVHQILPTARKSLDLIASGYRQGEFDYLTLLTAQRTFFNANLNYLNSLRELLTHYAELEGNLLRGGLQQVARGND